MKKVRSIVIIIAGTIFVLGIPILVNHAQDGRVVDWAKFGKALQKDAEAGTTASAQADDGISSDNIYARGKNATILKSDVEKATVYYEAGGMAREEAEAAAFQYLKEYEALYSEATEKGYSVTQDEVAEYVEEMKAAYESKEMDEVSHQEFTAIMQQFNTEQEYWEYEKTIYEKQLPVQKYVSDLEKEYFDSHPDAEDEEWIEYFEEYKASLVEKEKYM